MNITVTDLFDGVTPESSPVTIMVVEGTATSGGGGGAVDSVNGDVGVVVLDAADVGAAEAVHTHAQSDVTSLVVALAGKADDAEIAALDTRVDTLEALDPVLEGDSRLTDSRTPTAHATSHQDGGTDELALDGSQITSGTVADARIAATIARDSEVTSAVAAEATARDTAISSAVSAHEADTTSVHGIANTANLETTSGAQTKVDTHVNDTSAAHAASAIAFTPTGTVAATDVQAAIAEVASEAAGGGGTTILSGAYVPTYDDGSAGNYFLKTVGTPTLYGPKAATAAGVTDDFNRANAALSSPWTNNVGVNAVVSNQAAYSSGTAPAISTVDIGADATVTCTHAVGQADTGIVFRYVDASNFWLVFSTVLYKCVAGSFSSVGAGWASTTDLTIILSGTTIKVTNKATGAVLQTSTGQTDHLTGTKHGLRLNGAGRLDNFRAELTAWPVALTSA